MQSTMKAGLVLSNSKLLHRHFAPRRVYKKTTTKEQAYRTEKGLHFRELLVGQNTGAYDFGNVSMHLHHRERERERELLM